MTRFELSFTSMGEMVDGVAVNACIASGMIVIVEADKKGFISGIVSAHTSRDEAFKAYQPVEMDEGYAIIIPSEAGPRVFYSYLLKEEFEEVCSL